MKWYKSIISGTCYGCDCDCEEFYSPNASDRGPWICAECKEVIDRFLHLGGYILSTPIQVAPL